MRIHTTEELRGIDRHAADVLHLPTRVLMENAGAFVAGVASGIVGNPGRIWIVTGRGNNGGDGWVAARLLLADGRDVVVWPLGDVATLKGDIQANADAALACGVRTVLDLGDAGPDDVVVDALFGTGLTRAVEGEAAARIDAIIAARGQGAKVVAVDVPSGLDADASAAPEKAVTADVTASLHALKPALVQYPARALAGRIEVGEIGLPRVHQPGPARRWIDPERPGFELDRRSADAHKGKHGHVLVVAGSPDKTGAALLTCRGAFRAGAGLVTLASAPAVLDRAVVALPEAMTIPLPTLDAFTLLAALDRKTAIVIGPGLGASEVLASVIVELLSHVEIPSVLDADALNAIAANPEASEHLAGAKVPPILTPHPLELARLLGTDVKAVQADRFGAATTAAKRFHAHVVLKGACSVIAHPDGSIEVNGTGTPALGVGGTGDVLAGICGALVGQQHAHSASLAVWAHGRAGELAAQGRDRGLLASEVADAVPAALAELWR